MTTAGLYNRKIRFEVRTADANGDPMGPWSEVCTVSARVINLQATETVLAERLQGKQPANIYVRASGLTRSIDNTWRAIDSRSPADNPLVWAIAGAVLTEDRAEMLITANQQVGQTAR